MAPSAHRRYKKFDPLLKEKVTSHHQRWRLEEGP